MTATQSHLKPPVPVAMAVALHVASYVLGLIHSLLKSNYLYSIGHSIALLCVLAVLFVYLRALYRGRNWVRWLSVLLAVTGILYTPRTLAAEHLLWAKGIYLVQALLIGAAAVLVLLPVSDRWYRPNKSFKPNPLRGSA